MIYFNRPALVGNELKYIQDAVAQGMLCGDGKYTKLCSAWMKETFPGKSGFPDNILYACIGDGGIPE